MSELDSSQRAVVLTRLDDRPSSGHGVAKDGFIIVLNCSAMIEVSVSMFKGVWVNIYVGAGRGLT